MAQVKKTSVRKSILDAAFKQFSLNGYQATSMPVIAAEAGITAGNIYRYYASKFELFYDVLKPWLETKLSKLEAACEAIEDERERLQKILRFMWIELPSSDNNFAHNLTQALATKKPEDPYSRSLLLASEERVASLLTSCLPKEAKQKDVVANFAHLIFMSHDGFVLNTRLVDDNEQTNKIIYFIADQFFNTRTNGT